MLCLLWSALFKPTSKIARPRAFRSRDCPSLRKRSILAPRETPVHDAMHVVTAARMMKGCFRTNSSNKLWALNVLDTPSRTCVRMASREPESEVSGA